MREEKRKRVKRRWEKRREDDRGKKRREYGSGVSLS